jgi:hypothetical protein
MKTLTKAPKEPKTHEDQITLKQFLESFNKNMPSTFLQVTEADLLKFKEAHEGLFKNGESWSLDQHRKKIIDWLPRQK